MPGDVVVIGAGPAGLGVAGSLAARGIRARLLERDSVAASWRGHYDRLRLHTTPGLSALPGLAIPRRYGRWVARDDLIRYLEDYRAQFGLRVEPGVMATSVERLPVGEPNRWRVHAADGREWQARDVVVATGYNHTPVLPTWPGRATFPGALIHASEYRRPAPFSGRDVLVVGTGNTGCEIAQDLADGGADRVWLSYRTPPHIVRRDRAGWPAQWTGLLARRLSVPIVDQVGRLVRRATVPDLAPYGLPLPREGLYTRVRAGSIPVQDVGIVDAITSGRVAVVPTIARFDGPEVALVDGTRLRPDAVIVAAGYATGLAALVGHLQVLDQRGLPRIRAPYHAPGAPGLWFLGYTNPISGMLREIARDADRIAARIAESSAAPVAAGQIVESSAPTAARPASSRATGTRKGLHET